jgi:hypothetical protein
MARVRIGDVVEIPTVRGLAYAQYTHSNPQWGALLTVLPGFHGTRATDLVALVSQREKFRTFFPLQAAVARSVFEVVGNVPVPHHTKAFPRFRSAGFVDREGRVHDWYLWDGETSTKLEALTPDLRRLPILQVWNDTLLILRIEEEWAPEKDSR